MSSARVALSQMRYGFSVLLLSSLRTSAGVVLCSLRAMYGVRSAPSDLLTAGLSGVVTSDV